MSLLLLLGSGAAAAPAPTYATWNPADKGANIVLSNGDLSATNASLGSWHSVRATLAKSTGKWQFEVTIDASVGAAAIAIGVANSSANISNYVGSDANGWSYYGANGNKTNSGSGAAYGATFQQGDIITCYYDADTGTLGFMKNGADQGTIATGFSGEIFPMISIYTSSEAITANFGATSMTYPKAGYNERWATA